MEEHQKMKINNKKEIIITISVLIISIVIGFIAGKVLFDIVYGNI